MKLKNSVPLFFLILIAIIAMFYVPGPTIGLTEEINAGDTAWMLAASALVLLMTPGLAYFYGGMVHKKNIISTMLQSTICMAIVSIIWVVFGFSLAFGESIGGIFGNPFTFFMLKGVMNASHGTIPKVLFAFFQLKFAIITPALITGAFAERIKFTSYVLFICLFSIFIYAPLAHMTWHPDGLLYKSGVLDFAGGTVVHMSAGLSALASAIYLKSRNNSSHVETPANVPFVILGTGLLWFGWFGFNAGSALGANELASTAFATTNTASASAALAWIFFDSFKGKKPSALGTCIGAVVGLVAITPAAGYVSIPHSIVIGVVASLISNIMVDFGKNKSLDDTLDVFPCHGIGGMVGMLLTGIFASKDVNPSIEHQGLFFGEVHLFTTHVVSLAILSVFIFGISMLLLRITDWITPLRVTVGEQREGLDLSQHGESYV
jgi:Amt family ammonium transporter